MNDPAPVDPLRRRGIPLLLAAVAFAAGIASARHWHGPMLLLMASTALGALSLAALRWASRAAWAPVLGVWFAVGCWSAALQPPHLPPPGLHPYADGLSRTVRGHVVGLRTIADQAPSNAPLLSAEPWQIEPGGWETDAGKPTISLDLSLSAVEDVTPDRSTMRPVFASVRITLTGTPPPLRCGEVLEIPVRLREPEIYRDPGAFSYADWLANQDVGALATARADKIRIVTEARPGLRCLLSTAQRWATGRLASLPATGALRHLPAAMRLSPADAGMLAAMLFGDKTQLDAGQRAGFERTGTFHLFVVSGLHVTLITGAVFWLLRRLRVPELPAVGLTIVLALAYALLTGFGVPVQRALAMSSLFLIARALDRQHTGLNALGFAALLILVADPRSLGTASFQMTALVIFAVAGLALPIGQRLLGPWRAVSTSLDVVEADVLLPPPVASGRVSLRLWSALLADLLGSWAAPLPAGLLRLTLHLAQATVFSVAIELCMALPMALYFHRMVPLALPGNLCVAPLAVVLAGAAALTFAASLLSPWLALVPAVVTAALLHLVEHIVAFLGNAHLGDMRVPSPPAASILLFGLLALGTLMLLRVRRHALAAVGLLTAAALPLVVLWPARPQLHPNRLEVTAIDVGQGDSLFVVSPTGRTMLIDAGGSVGRVSTKWDVGEEVVAPYLWSRRIRRLDAVVISHGHSDHIGGMPAILRDLRPRELWLSLQPGQSVAMRSLLAEAASLGIEIHWLAAGDHLAWGGLDADVLAPERSYSNYGEARNDDSLVLQLSWQRASVLLEGDAEVPSEEAMVANHRIHAVTLLKVGHHGSRTSTTPAFLAAAAPRFAVISVGQHNTFGHPRWEVLDRLEAAHVRTFRTDREGARSFFLGPDGEVSAESANPPETSN